MTSNRDHLGRQVLPIPDQQYAGLVTYDAKDPATSFPPIEPLRPPSGAPNVLIVLIDDVGFAASSPFGGPIGCPTAERLAAGGLQFNRFHTTALCSPTRQALLTGRNHHAVGMGGITEIATSAPGYSSIRPNTAAPLAETLKLNGYSTAQFGKCHEVPVWETSPMGPFTQWPTGSGFEHFYGFIGGETNQWAPAIYRDTVAGRARPDGRGGLPLHRGHDRPGHRLGPPAEGADARQAVLRVLRARRHPRPAPRAEGVGRQVQGPLRPGLGPSARGDVRPPEGARRDPGRCRAHRPARPRSRRGTTCPTTSSRCWPARWRSTPASSSTPTTTSAGSSTPSPTSSILDDTLVYLIIGDNGASAEGTPNGCFNELIVVERRRRARDRRVHGVADRRLRVTRRPTTTTPSAGPTPWTRRTSGPSRSRRTGAAPATARSCTGRTASRPRARSARSSTTSSTSPPRSSTPPACRRR